MKKLILNFLYIIVAGFVPAACISSLPVVPGVLHAEGALTQRLQADNVTTTGKIVEVTPSTADNGAARVVYSYDAPGYPRNGNSGSFQRAQLIEPQAVERFRIGMPVQVEYSRSLAGVSRLQGYGTGSVYVAEQAQDLLRMAMILFPTAAFGAIFALFLKKWRGETGSPIAH